MTSHYRTFGLVVKKVNAGVADCIFTVLTEDFGKIKILGKAIRKITSKLKSSINYIGLSEIEFIQGKVQKTLIDAELLDCYKNAKCDLPKLKVVHKIADVVNSLVSEEEMDSDVYNLLKDSFDRLNNSELTLLQSQMIYFYFIWNLFNLLGYKPEVYKCVVCQKKLPQDNIYFSSDGAGLVCSDCIKTVKFFRRINADVVKVLRLILPAYADKEKDIATLLKLRIPISSGKLLREITNDYYFHLLSSHLSVKDFKREKILIQ
jgi:DNA repair protein RecO (recombination protein O)